MSSSLFLPLIGTIPRVFTCQMEANRAALKIFSPLLRTYLSQHAEGMFWGPWVLVQKVCVRRGAQGCGETLSLALQCPVVEGTRGEVEGQTFDDP